VEGPDDAHLPVDLGRALLAEGLIGCPAARAVPLVLGQVVEHLFGLWCRVVPPAMPGAAGPLATTTATVAGRLTRICRLPGGVSPSTPGLALLLSLLLRRGAEADLGERGDLLRRSDELTFEIDGSRLRGLQLCDEPLLVRGKASCLFTPTVEPIYKPPTLTIVLGPGPHDHQHTRWRTLCSVPSVTWAYDLGIWVHRTLTAQRSRASRCLRVHPARCRGACQRYAGGPPRRYLRRCRRYRPRRRRACPAFGRCLHENLGR